MGYKPTYYFWGHYIVQEHIRFHGEKETCFLVTLWQTNITMENHNFSWVNQLFLWPFSMSQTVSLPEGKIFPSTNDWLIHTWINPLISNTTIYMVPNRCRSSTSTMVSGVCFIWIRTAWLIWLIIYNVYIYIYTNRYDIIYIYICTNDAWKLSDMGIMKPLIHLSRSFFEANRLPKGPESWPSEGTQHPRDIGISVGGHDVDWLIVKATYPLVI